MSSALKPFTDAASRNRSALCVGLDTDIARLDALPLPEKEDPQAAFNRLIIEKTADLVCAYKPNLAFYESRGRAGWAALEETLAQVPPEVPVILDAKRGDIGNTAQHYARALFEGLGGAAVTVNPLLGEDSVRPFLDYPDRVTFLLCHTSNPGAMDFERHGEPMLYRRIAEKAAAWNAHGNVGLVVGATWPETLAEIRELVGPEMPLLAPGVGAQGAGVEELLEAGRGAGPGRLIINASRSVLFAGTGADFAAASRAEAEALRGRCRALFS